jgi:hypothetical protein
VRSAAAFAWLRRANECGVWPDPAFTWFRRKLAGGIEDDEEDLVRRRGVGRFFIFSAGAIFSFSSVALTMYGSTNPVTCVTNEIFLKNCGGGIRGADRC